MTNPRWATVPEATRVRWVRVLADITPGNLSVMSRWALHTAARRGETQLISPLVDYAMHWHDWGFAPDEWWMLISALRAETPDLDAGAIAALEPSAWAGWPALLADHAPLSALTRLRATTVPVDGADS